MNVPYTQECNDVAMMLIQHHKASSITTAPSTSSSSYTRTRATAPASWPWCVHPYIMGAPHRLKYFRDVLEHIRRKRGVVFWTGEQILDWYRSQQPPPRLASKRCRSSSFSTG